MVLAALDHGAEDGEERELRDAGPVGPFAPVARLVDERLADVEHDRPHSHDATSSRSSGEVTLTRRGSPSTILMRPPRASTSAAQSVPSPSAAPRRTDATNACGVWA